MRCRTRYENELMELLASQGWSCVRSAGSRGPVDVLAINEQRVRLIQVKSTRRLDRPGNVSVFKHAIRDLQTLPRNEQCQSELWVEISPNVGGGAASGGVLPLLIASFL